MRALLISLTNFLLVVAPVFTAAGVMPSIPWEESGGMRTPGYGETLEWFSGLAATSDILEFSSFGTSAQGRVLPVVIADLDGRFDPEMHRDRTDHVVMLVQACIHAGESCGKDAGMVLLRDLAGDPDLAAGLLRRVTIVFVPIFNVDGHARFGPYNRINQNGPEEMGWRRTAQNRNLNRDYLKADTPEMRAWHRLFQAWMPDFFMDIHSTDGADYQYPITYVLETRGNMDPGLTEWTQGYRARIEETMPADGFPIFPYVSFRSWHDPRSGLKLGPAGPRYSYGYTAIQNRPGILVETHMLKPYAVRVEASLQLWHRTLEWLNLEADSLRRQVLAADARTAAPEFRTEPLTLSFERTEEFRVVEFLGFEYEMVTSEVTGGEYPVFSDRKETMQLEFYEENIPLVSLDLPEGWIVPPEWDVVRDRLDIHGIAYEVLAEPTPVEVRSWKFRGAGWAERPYEGHHVAEFQADPVQEVREFPRGSLIVDMNQRSARVVAHLLDPRAPDSMVRWGYLDAIFEQAEYAESYVIEAMIPKMLEEDPGLAAEFAEAKAADPEFAGNIWAVRNWFYMKTPYFDQKMNIYPVGMVDDRDVLDSLPRQDR